jgi:UDP-N-acetylglucosamine acyltransferase
VNIHPLAVVNPEAHLGNRVTIGPFAVIESDVEIGEDCSIAAHAVVKQGTTLGAGNEVCEAAILGGHPQHVHKPQTLGRLVIGNHNTIREHVTMHRAMKPGEATIVGDHNFIMAAAHVAHDCRVGNHVVMANSALLGGHVTVDDRAFVSGNVAVHQFCRIGTLAMVGGLARVVQDVPPFMLVDGISGCIVGLNLVGLRRNGFTSEQVAEIKRAYRVVYRHGLKWADVLQTLAEQFSGAPVSTLYQFLSGGTRGFVQERRLPPGATIKLRQRADESLEAQEAPAASLPELRSKAG